MFYKLFPTPHYAKNLLYLILLKVIHLYTVEHYIFVDKLYVIHRISHGLTTYSHLFDRGYC